MVWYQFHLNRNKFSIQNITVFHTIKDYAFCLILIHVEILQQTVSKYLFNN